MLLLAWLKCLKYETFIACGCVEKVIYIVTDVYHSGNNSNTRLPLISLEFRGNASSGRHNSYHLQERL